MSRSVGEFTLIGHLGEGSFATVFLARHRERGMEFAMKAIRRARIKGKLQENLESEISILKSFRHGNIVELYDIKKTERHIYLVLEYCAGGDLRALIKKEGRLTETSARHFMRHLGSGLHFLWSKNLIHRDLKPQNLLLTGPGLDATLKIADFGFARHLAHASMAETICGSPLYMAPEILQGQKYGAKSDLWSVGAILFEMLAGKPPFGGANQIQLLANIRRGPNPPAREGVYPLPEGVTRPGRSCSELLCRLLVPDPQHRASFREFFHSDVLRSASSPRDGGSERGLSSSPSSRRRDSLTSSSRREPWDRSAGTSSPASAPKSLARAAGAGGDLSRTPEGSYAPATAMAYASATGQRASFSQSRGGTGGTGDVLKSPRGKARPVSQGQQASRGGWWPLTGWPWGGGGRGAGGGGGGPGAAHERSVSRSKAAADEDSRFSPLTRRFSEPVAAFQQQQQQQQQLQQQPHRSHRLQTPPSRGGTGAAAGAGVGGAGGEYYGQPPWASRSSRGAWGGQQATPLRPPLTPPSPAQGSSASSSSRRFSGTSAVPIPIRQQHQQQQQQHGAPTRGTGGGGGGYRGGGGYSHDTRGDPTQEEGGGHAPWSPSDTGGRSRYSSKSHWPQYDGGGGGGSDSGGGDSPSDGHDGDSEIAPLKAYERQHLRPHGPNSAPEISYIGQAAARAHERGVAAAAAAAAGIRGVAFSLTGGDGRRFSGDLGPTAMSARESPEMTTPSTPGRSSMRGLRAEAGSRHSRQSSLDLSARAMPEQSPGRESERGRQASGVSHTENPERGVDVEGTSESFPALSSSPPERYPLRAATMVGGTVAATGISVASTGLGLANRRGAGGRDGEGVDGLDPTLRARLEQETAAHQHHPQHQPPNHQQAQSRADSSDGSGGSDDFVLVDGSPPNPVGPAGGGGVTGANNTNTTTYRIGGGDGTGEGDPRATLGPRLVAAGGRWMWGGSGQISMGWPQSVIGAAARGVGDGYGGGFGGRSAVGSAPLSLDGVVRCLQIVELFGRRAVLLAQLGDSRVTPAMQCRRRDVLEGSSPAATGAWSIANGRSSGRTTPFGLFAQGGGNNGGFSRDATSKPPLFVDEDEPWLPPSAGSPIVSSHPVLGTTSEGDGGSDRCHDGCGRGSCNFSGSNGGGDDAAAGKGSSACCDSHRLFGEALVVYLKSLSMAKEAIVWGHQALESLPAASSRHPPPPPPPPPSIPQSTPPPSSIPGPPSGSSLLWSPRGGPGRAVTTREDSVSGQSSQHAGQGLKGGLSRMDATPAGGVDSGSSPPGETPSSSSSEVQVAAWGTSLLAWLAGQFSTVLRRAERCRTELRGSAATSSGVSTAPGETAEREALSSSPSILSRSTDVAANVGGDVDSSVGVFADTDAVDGGTSSDNAASPPISDAANASLRAETIKDGVGTRAQPEAVLGTPEPGTVPAASYSAKEGGTRKSSGEHGAAPGAVAVSARDIVVRAALCQAQESAASEVLGMWEPARQGYEKAALLLETLLLDALLVRPEGGGTALNRSSIVNNGSGSGSGMGRSGTTTGGGVLGEEDQRVLQNYMARFARRAADIVRMEKEEVRAAAASKAASIATSAALTPPTTATVQAERVYTGDTTTAV